LVEGVEAEQNGAPLDVPVETVRTTFHCIHVRPDRSLSLADRDGASGMDEPA
jgi:hypothetical protein